MLRAAIGTLIALALTATSLSAAETRSILDLQLEVIRRELPQTTVHSILQSRDGYIWASTYEGVVKMDGASFAVVDRRSSSGGLGSNGVLELWEDDGGAIWFGTFLGGVSRLDGREWKTWGPGEGLEGEFVRAIRATPDGTHWVGSNAGLFTIEGDRAARASDERLQGSVRRLVTAPDGELLVGYDDGRLIRRKADGTLVEFTSHLSGHGVFAIAVGPDGAVWAGTDGGGVFRIGDSGTTRYGLKDGLTSEKIRALMIDPDGSVWIGTEGGGLNRLTSNGVESLLVANGMPNDIVRAISRDREGTIWLGTNGGGLVALKLHKFALYTTRRGMSSDAVRVILQARDGAIWIGTDGGGVNVVRNGGISVIGTADGLPNDFARSLLEARDGTMWIGTVGGGLAWHRNGVTRRFDGPLPSDTILSLAETPDGALWVGTNRGLVEVRNHRVVRTIDSSTGLGDANVSALQVDSKGRVWAGTASGLFIIHGNGIETVPLEGALYRSIFCIRLEADGTAWLGSNGGIARVRDGRVFQFQRTHGLPEEAVFQILQDESGSFWLTGNRGITRVSRADLERIAADGKGRAEATRFGRADGMYTDQCNGASQPAGWAAQDGTLWFPTPWGAATISARHMPSNEFPPPVAIERIRIDGVPVEHDGKALELDAGQHRIEVDYAAMSFIAPEGVRFRTRLEGLDPDWVDAGARRTEIYTNIGPGKYRFRVIASNNDGVWNEEGASFDVRVEPYFWQQPPFIAIAITGALLLIWGIVRLRVVQLVEHREQLENLVEQRTAELEEANRRLQHLSDTDPLTGAANRRRFDDALATEWKRAYRSEDELSILMVDVDHFKDFNDEHGHQSGDLCLKQIAFAIVASARRAGDIVARYGGDEFAAILPTTSKDAAEVIAESARDAVERLGFQCRSGNQVTLSIGVATASPKAGGTEEQLLAAADAALYRAKKGGRNRITSTHL